MQEKAFGSLTGSLLARKGGAKPAMRPQAFRFDQGDDSASDDDCGWNDMGTDMLTPEQRTSLLPEGGASISSIVTAPVREADDYDSADGPPAVVTERDALASSFGPQLPDEELSPELDAEEEEQQSAFLARLQSEATGNGELEEEALDALQPATPAPIEEAVSTVAPTHPAQPKPVQPPKKRAAPGTKAKSAFTLRLDKARHLKLRLACAFSHKSAQKLMTAALDEYLERHHPDLPA